jgi:la-related protein 1
MDSQGWIPVHTVASFNRLRRLTPDTQVVRDMMVLSSLVELSPDGEKARMAHGAWTPFVLPDAQDASASSAASEPTMGGTSPATSVDADGGAEGKGALGLVGVGGGEGA